MTKDAAVNQQIQATIRQSNAETDSEIIKERIGMLASEHDGFQLVYKKAAELTAEQKEFCCSQLRAFYFAGQRDGWVEDGTKEYLDAVKVGEEEDSLYLIIKAKDAESCYSFALFKYSFDWEDDEDEEEAVTCAEDDEQLLPVPCLYLYQLHTASSKQGCGYGSLLLGILEDLAIKYRFPKLKLTVLKGNKRASDFYLNHGFCIDCTDPSNYDFEPDHELFNCSYSIYSKSR